MGCRSLLVVAGVALALSGCSAPGSDLLQVTGVGATSARTEPLPTPAARATVVAAARRTLRTTAAVTGEVAMRGTGTTIHLGPLPRVVRYRGSYDFTHTVGTLTVGLDGAAVPSLRTVLTRRAVYVSHAGKNAWSALRRATVHAHQLYRTPSNDPAAVLRLVVGVEEMAYTGQETVAATATRRYRGYVTVDALTRNIAAADRPAAVALLRQLGPQGRRIVVNLSPAGRVVRVVLGFRATQAGGHVEETAQLELSGFGRGVRVRAPKTQKVSPASETSDILLG
jgi:hypothetical protein